MANLNPKVVKNLKLNIFFEKNENFKIHMIGNGEVILLGVKEKIEEKINAVESNFVLFKALYNNDNKIEDKEDDESISIDFTSKKKKKMRNPKLF